MIRRLHIHSNLDDFLQVGYLGLWYAYRDYDEEKGPLSSYAFMRVRYEMLTMLRKDSTYQARHAFRAIRYGYTLPLSPSLVPP
ncbi:hypothetical protein EPH95_03970 [Salicibibacter halophilus]|uniref:RNA polymerase sigma-70 region 2 domain-containing protein n=2 Tax=Salicibibacter halophilus TaxID=2502791 RepID=A0A514LF18_9BACI|nr:hypothetical protein EPH95_03970 [Salicibibacter halophilus]